MISIRETGVQPAPVNQTPTPATDYARPSLRVEFAIMRPDGLWWRELGKRVADPDSEEPSVYHSRGAAEDALADVIGTVEDVYGATHYRPWLMVREVVTHGGRTTVRAWHGIDMPAAVTR